MAKRGNNDGTIRQRKDGLWEARITVGNSPDGKQKRKSIYGKTQGEVQSKMRELLTKVERGEYTETGKITVGSWLDTWCETYGAPHWREKTLEVNRDNIRLHLKPALGKIQLSKLRPDQVQAYINAEIKCGAAYGSIKRRIAPLKSALAQAVQNKMLYFNPAQNVQLPAAQQKEIDFLTVDEQRQLIPYLPDNTAGRALRFILSTGLRASELCGLRWSDIDESSFTIRQSAQYVRDTSAKEGQPKQRLSLAAPKTKAGKRTIPLTDAAKNLLESQRAAQRQQRLQVGVAWQGGPAGSGDTPVFASEVGTYYDRSNLDRTLRDCLKRAGLKTRGIHALRHTFATNWVKSGADLRTLSEILGHTKVAFTMQQYVHSDMTTKLEGLKGLENIV